MKLIAARNGLNYNSFMQRTSRTRHFFYPICFLITISYSFTVYLGAYWSL